MRLRLRSRLTNLPGDRLAALRAYEPRRTQATQRDGDRAYMLARVARQDPSPHLVHAPISAGPPEHWQR